MELRRIPKRRRRGVAAAFLSLLAGWPGPTAAVAGTCDGISTALDDRLTSVRVADGLLRPLFVTAAPGDFDRLFLVEQDGRIRILEGGALLPGPFLDLSALVLSPADGGGNEEGLLGFAFHPGFAGNGWFFVYHTNLSGNNVVARYGVSLSDPNLADPATRTEVITFPHPTFANHNAGMLAFGPADGHLYIATGDGGGACDPPGNAQNGGSFLGKILRIDVDALPYTVPPENPFVGDLMVRDEIWAMGLRNPWRFAFDRATADLFIGDVGQNIWEEINYQPAGSPGGENYGWDFWEGTHCPNPSCGGSAQDCTAIPDPVLPVLEYDHGQGCSVTGGYAYRGCRVPALHGTYFYADFCGEFIRSFRIEAGAPVDLRDWTASLVPPGGFTIDRITSFGEDARGEIYVVDRNGEVFKILPVLNSLEVSGPGADPFRLDPSVWSWEDLQATSTHPISAYRVYRATTGGTPTFECILQTPVPSWPGGDPEDPPSGSAFLYLVTAVNTQGEETHPGSGSDGTARVLSPFPCPP